MDREQIMWAQKAKKDWDLKGDRNTKFFQAVVRARRRRNQISQIKTQDNTWLSEHQEIEQHFVDHYINLFSDTQSLPVEDIQNQLLNIPIPTLTPQQNSILDQPIRDEEIIEAVNQLGPLKTPSPDGVPTAFYQ